LIWAWWVHGPWVWDWAKEDGGLFSGSIGKK